MSEPTVVVVENDDEGQAAGGAEFAAGVAAATSAQASEEAGEAVQAAEVAQGTADVALSVADAAEANAWDAKAGVAELRDEMLALFEEMRAGLAVTAAAVVEEVTEEAPEHPAPESKDTTEKSHGDEKPKRTAYGAKTWFG